jgi:serine/threonine protein kinase
MPKLFIDLLKTIFIVCLFFAQSALALKGVPDSKRFRDCQELYSKEKPTDQKNSRPAGSTFVHVCFDTFSERLVIIKASRGRFKDLLMNEAMIFSYTKDLPGVIKHYETISDAEWHYIFLEYCSHGDLYNFIEAKKYLPEHEARLIFGQLATIISALHDLKIVHLDLKLENFFLENKVIKVGDFGISEYLREKEFSQKRRGTSCGMAPEIYFVDKKFDPYKADVFALGSILFSILVGGSPFEVAALCDINYQCIAQKGAAALVRGFKLSHYIGPKALELLDKMLSHDPDKRPTMKEVLTDPWLTEDT